jgi:hypothetical protein
MAAGKGALEVQMKMNERRVGVRQRVERSKFQAR